MVGIVRGGLEVSKKDPWKQFKLSIELAWLTGILLIIYLFGKLRGEVGNDGGDEVSP